jgi:hypothetical protein
MLQPDIIILNGDCFVVDIFTMLICSFNVFSMFVWLLLIISIFTVLIAYKNEKNKEKMLVCKVGLLV